MNILINLNRLYHVRPSDSQITMKTWHKLPCKTSLLTVKVPRSWIHGTMLNKQAVDVSQPVEVVSKSKLFSLIVRIESFILETCECVSRVGRPRKHFGVDSKPVKPFKGQPKGKFMIEFPSYQDEVGEDEALDDLVVRDCLSCARGF